MPTVQVYFPYHVYSTSTPRVNPNSLQVRSLNKLKQKALIRIENRKTAEYLRRRRVEHI